MHLSIKQKILIVSVTIFLIILVTAVLLLRPYPAEQDYLDKVYSNEKITVNELDSWYVIESVESQSEGKSNNEAIIFYPGGLVSANAYLYMLSDIAIETHQPIYVVKFPLSLAVTDIYAADKIIEAYPEVETWTISGHSLGGSMACRYAKTNPDKTDKLILMASYCDQSISDTRISVLTLYGSRNNGIDDSKLKEYEQNLPPGSTTVLIQGMNHAQFGNYGPQRGDAEPEINNDEATGKVVTETVKFLSQE